MDPADSPDIEALRDGISSVLQAECTPAQVHAFIDGRGALDRSLWRRAAESGWLGLGLPESGGGLGLGVAGLDLLQRELGRHYAPGAYLATLSAAAWLLECGDDALRARWLPRVADGSVSIAVPAVLSVHGEAPSAAARMLGAIDADLVVAPVDGGWGLFGPVAAALPVEGWDRTRTLWQADFGSARPLAVIEDRDGLAGDALLKHLSLAVASDSVGGARAIATTTLEYLKVRQQFGRPIGSFQALKHRAADLMASLATQELLVTQAYAACAEAAPDAAMWAALAKAGASEAYAFIAADCTQLHGGVGFTWDFDCHVAMKRARLNEALVASSARLRDRAATWLAAACRAGRSTVDLPLA